jgi:hypothetical protein
VKGAGNCNLANQTKQLFPVVVGSSLNDAENLLITNMNGSKLTNVAGRHFSRTTNDQFYHFI